MSNPYISLFIGQRRISGMIAPKSANAEDERTQLISSADTSTDAASGKTISLWRALFIPVRAFLVTVLDAC